MAPVALAVLLLYGVALVGLGLWVSRSLRGAEDFYVAGRRLGPGVLGATVLAANVGSGSTVGATGLAYDAGASAWWWVGSAAIGTLILAAWVGPRIWRIARRLDCYTVGDYLEARYTPGVRYAAMGIMWVGSIFILAGQLAAMGTIVWATTGAPVVVGTIVGGLVVLLYYGAGGLWSSSLVNVVELGVKVVAFPVAVLTLSGIVGGIGAVRDVAARMPIGTGGYLSPVGQGPAWVLGLAAVLVPSFVISPGLLQKAFGARDAATVRRGLGWSGVALLAFAAVPVALGVLARAHWTAVPPGVPVESFDWVLPRLLVDVLPPAVGLLALAAVVSAELSSADAVLFMLSTSMSRDFYQGWWNPHVDDDGLLRAGRVAAIVGLVLGVAAALALQSVLAALATFYGLMVIALAVPLLAGIYFPSVDARGAWAALVTALIVFGAVHWSGWPATGDFWPYVLGAGGGAVACAGATLLGGLSVRA